MRPGWVAGVALLFPAVLAAQSVDLLVRDQASGRPVAGAIVRLVGGTTSVDRGLTNEAGRLTLRAAAAGSYHLRLDRIGYGGLTTQTFVLDGGAGLRLTVDMPSDRLSLPTLEVTGKRGCDAKGQGPLAAAMWDEVQKALTANLITSTRGAVPLHLREFRREVDLKARPLREWVVVSRIVRGPPFNAFPAARLDSTGFVFETGDSATFALPDAALLLSDRFVAGHCFYAVQGKEGLAGLGFQPVKSRRLPDVTGTLWIDRESLALRSLEYKYTLLPGALASLALGGRLDFTQLPSGAWMVSYWYVRMPRLAHRATVQHAVVDLNREVLGYLDQGGKAEVAGDTTGLIHRAIVVGTVFDSTEQRGLPEARIWVVGAEDTLVTDREGKFSLAIDASGDHVITVRHPKLGLLGEPTRRTVLLSLGEVTRVDFGVPSLSVFLRRVCPRRTEAGLLGAVVGVGYRSDGSRAGGLRAVASRQAATGYERIKDADVATGHDGLYCLTNLPVAELIISLMNGKLSLVEATVEVPAGGRWLDLREWGTADTAIVRFNSVVPPDTNRVRQR